jgi:hypothetical protein
VFEQYTSQVISIFVVGALNFAIFVFIQNMAKKYDGDSKE